MLGILQSKGLQLTSDVDEAECVVINTCGFLESASEEAIDAILETARLKKRGRLQRLIVTGCFVQRYGYKLAREMPEVDGWLGSGQIDRIADILDPAPKRPAPFFINRPTFLPDIHHPKVQATPFYTAYLKVAEGCSHRCAYCLIPGLRGPFRSRPMESLVQEAEDMAERGVMEINLIAQDLTWYGKDIYGESRLIDLLAKLVNIHGVQWIRLLYLHPARVSDALLDLMDAEEVVCPYVDVPLQHVDPDILAAMNRGPLEETAEALIARIRSRRRRIGIRTTLMVGFPGETDEKFDRLCEFVETAEIDHVGVFAFSPEKGSPAARLRPQIDAEIKEARLGRIMRLQAEVSKRINQRHVGRTLPVLIEGLSSETDLLLSGRTAAMAPDVDTKVLINEGTGLAGSIMPVEITEAHTYDLVGRILQPSPPGRYWREIAENGL